MLALRGPVLALPLIGSLPDQPPEPVQLLAFVTDQVSVAAEPLLTVTGLALRVITGLAAAFTVIANASSDADAVPSLTLITIPLYVPTSLADGVPLIWPVAMLNVAQAGLLVIENDSVWPAGPLAVGVNEYVVPAVTLVGGVPEMVGGDGAETLTVTAWLAVPPDPLQVSP